METYGKFPRLLKIARCFANVLHERIFAYVSSLEGRQTSWVINENQSCLGRNCCHTAKLLSLLMQEYSCFGHKPLKSYGIFLPTVMNVRGKKGADSPVALLPFVASALGCHTHHCTLQCSCDCSCVRPHLNLCFLLQPSIALRALGPVGVWGSTCCHLPTSSATGPAKISIQPAVRACVSSWTSLVVHGEPCYACLGSSCGLGVCHLCFYPVLKGYET